MCIWSRRQATSSPPMGWVPRKYLPSPLFANYWQHVSGPASYVLGFGSISDNQPCIC